MSLFSSLQVSSSGMAAQRTRAELLVENMANSETTRTPEGGPYRRKDVVFSTDAQTSPFSAVFQNEVGTGVTVADVVRITRHPDALPTWPSRRRRQRLRRVSPHEPGRRHGGPFEFFALLSSQHRGHLFGQDMISRSIDIMR